MRKIKSNKTFLLLLVTMLGIAGILAAPKVWFNLTHKMPSPKKMQKVFPGDTRSTLENAKDITLFSLDGSIEYHPSKTSLTGQFHGYPILGQTKVSDKTKDRLVAEIYNGLAPEDKFRAACFNPHHGVRASYKGKTVDCLICYSCGHFLVYALGIETTNATTSTPEKFFNQLLENAGVPFDPQYKR